MLSSSPSSRNHKRDVWAVHKLRRFVKYWIYETNVMRNNQIGAIVITRKGIWACFKVCTWNPSLSRYIQLSDIYIQSYFFHVNLSKSLYLRNNYSNLIQPGFFRIIMRNGRWACFKVCIWNPSLSRYIQLSYIYIQNCYFFLVILFKLI